MTWQTDADAFRQDQLRQENLGIITSSQMAAAVHGYLVGHPNPATEPTPLHAVNIDPRVDSLAPRLTSGVVPLLALAVGAWFLLKRR